jgi:hypothetical protein
LVCAALVKVTTGRAFRTDQRCGFEGKPFLMYRLNVDRHPTRGLEVWLNRLSLTELPQVWNVLRGEMSIVGPRPEPIARVKHYSDWERRRLLVKPGLTGLAQVHGLREHHSSAEKSRYDLMYVSHWSPLQDWIFLLYTVVTVLRRCREPRRADPPQNARPAAAVLPTNPAPQARGKSA